MLHVVEQVAADTRGRWRTLARMRAALGSSSTELSNALRAIDGRWGYNCKRGDCGSLSVDVVDYYRGQGNPQHSSDVAIIDVIGKVCGPGANPTPSTRFLATRELRSCFFGFERISSRHSRSSLANSEA